jgi:NADPH:quinone reductase-like Zn-dependent oxidoreductase
MSATMKAWQVSRWGLANLKVVEREIPRPGPGEVLVRVRAVSLNYRDKVAVEGHEAPYGTPSPYTPCGDLAGEIAGVGPGVEHWSLGDRVSANFYTRWLDGQAAPDMDVRLNALSVDTQGVLAEYAVVPAPAVVRAPASLSMEETATLPVAGVTAWSALVTLGQLKAGQSVLLLGTGGVSLFGLQFARMLGARAIVTSRSAEKLERAKALGATDVVDTSRHPEWASQVLELTGGRGVDHIFEAVGGDSYRQSVAAAAMGARISTIGFLGDTEFTVPIGRLIVRRIVIQGLSVGHRRSFEDMIAAIDLNGLKPVIDRVYDWKDVPAAFGHLERGPFGKVVVSINP